MVQKGNETLFNFYNSNLLDAVILSGHVSKVDELCCPLLHQVLQS